MRVPKLPFTLINLITVFAILLSILSSPSLGKTSALQADLYANNNPSDTKQVYLPMISSNADAPGSSWPMVGANLQRTSWTSEEVRGKLKPLWYRPFEAYIPQKAQVIAAYGTLFISTSAGLYALYAGTGELKWVYPTLMPLGNSPTVFDGVVYVGGLDHKLHAIDATTGKLKWTFEAGAGFDTNPLIAEGKVFAGNRDGSFYAVSMEGPNAGKQAWKYTTQGPIHFSAAYQDGILYFASDDSYAYALNANNGSLVWKSAKLPGAGFHSWWPVVYEDWVVFAGSNNYRSVPNPGTTFLNALDRDDIYPNRATDPKNTFVGPVGQAPGDWVAGTTTIDTSRPNTATSKGTMPVTEYFEQKPWRRTYFVLNRATGQEYTTDFDKDIKPEYAPILWFGTKGAGNRYPPVVGSDGVLYQSNDYVSSETIAQGNITGWQIGTPYISTLLPAYNIDEPLAYSAGGRVIYWSRCCDRLVGAVDVTLPETAPNRDWTYFSYNLPDVIPDYNVMTYVSNPYTAPWGGVYGGLYGSYNWHGDGNPPIPYQGKVYFIASNAVVAFAPGANQPEALPTLAKVEPESSSSLLPSPPSEDQLRGLLTTEVQKMLDAGHLRPGYLSSGLFDNRADKNCGDYLVDYWHNPGDVIVALLETLPFLPTDMQSKVRTYLQNEFNQFPPYQYDHIGWRDGAPREPYELPPEVDADRVNFPPLTSINGFAGWNFAPQGFYASWKYAQTFGGAQAIFEASKSKLNPAPSDQVLAEMPHVHNAYIAGYWGYLELQKLAGYPEDSRIRSELNRLLALRISNFTKLPPASYFQQKDLLYCRTLNISLNFIYLVPELGQYFRDHALAQIEDAVNDYERLAPLWFVSKNEAMFGEGVINSFYDYSAIFQAKALILQEPREQLARFLDVPATSVGDLFYIQNLVSVLNASRTASVINSDHFCR